MDIQPDTRPDIGLDIPESVKSDSNKPKTKGGKGLKTFITLVVVIIILVVAGYLINQYT